MKFADAAKRWNARYQGADGPLFGASPNDWLAQHASRLHPESDVLCIADGDGRNGLHLAALGHHVVSFDIAQVAVDAARRAAADRGLELDARVGDLSSWQWAPDSLDAVVAIYIQFADPASRDVMFESVKRALRPGGLLIVEGYGLQQLHFRTGGPGVAENLYSVDLLARAFPHWPVLASRNCVLELAEGSAHLGRSHVISAVLQRPQAATPSR